MLNLLAGTYGDGYEDDNDDEEFDEEVADEYGDIGGGNTAQRNAGGDVGAGRSSFVDVGLLPPPSRRRVKRRPRGQVCFLCVFWE